MCHQLSQFSPKCRYRMPPHDVGPIRMLCIASPWAQPQERLDSRGPATLSFVMPSYVCLLCKTMGYLTHLPAAVDQNVLGIVGYSKQCPKTRDLAAFMEEFCTDRDDATFAD
ncbi:hypothetical protein EDB84DRAFT_1437819 [Lactarius hengduanensis]|nr:hypothetical protein EDB84DRAFT_1437819 [Lactarius hengduanensis]